MGPMSASEFVDVRVWPFEVGGRVSVGVLKERLDCLVLDLSLLNFLLQLPGGLPRPLGEMPDWLDGSPVEVGRGIFVPETPCGETPFECLRPPLVLFLVVDVSASSMTASSSGKGVSSGIGVDERTLLVKNSWDSACDGPPWVCCRWTFFDPGLTWLLFLSSPSGGAWILF